MAPLPSACASLSESKWAIEIARANAVRRQFDTHVYQRSKYLSGGHDILDQDTFRYFQLRRVRRQTRFAED